MPTLPLDHPHKNLERFLSYAYFINKLIDLLDTIFFVLRKNFKQITFLHVFHHYIMPTGIYWISRFYGMGAQYMIMGLLNVLVHVPMYSYYLLTALNPRLTNVWWKKYITMAQLVQFFVLFMLSLITVIFSPDCEFPIGLQYMWLIFAILFMTMFGKFYYNTYVKLSKRKMK